MPVISRFPSIYQHFQNIRKLTFAFRLDLTPASAVCLALQNDPKCLGVKCNSSSSNCEIVEAPSVSPITCIENPLTPEDGIFIRDDFVQRQSGQYTAHTILPSRYIWGAFFYALSIFDQIDIIRKHILLWKI